MTARIKKICTRIITVVVLILGITIISVMAKSNNDLEINTEYLPATCTMTVKRVLEFTPNGYVTSKANTFVIGKQCLKDDGKVEFMLQAGTGENKQNFVIEISYENLD